jgi:hypothetical protein
LSVSVTVLIRQALTAAIAACLSSIAPLALADDADAVVLQDVQALIAVEAAAAPADANLQLEPYLAQYRPVVKTELSFANRVCKFTPEQRAAVIDDAKTWLKEYAAKQAKGQPAQNAGMWMQLGGVRAQHDASPRRSLEDGVAEVVKKHVTEEQKAAYEKEFNERREFHVATVVENLVAVIDEKLYLSQEQREQMTADLKENWDDSWGLQLQHFTYMSNYLPNMPADRVVKHLNKEQTARWNGIQKVSFGQDLNQEHQWVGGQTIDDIDLGEEPQPQPAVPRGLLRIVN